MFRCSHQQRVKVVFNLFCSILFVSLSGLYANAHTSDDHGGQHFKPGVDAVFSHSYQGQSEVHQQDTFELSFSSSSSHSEQYTSITLNPDKGLTVHGQTEFEFNTPQNEITFPVTISSQVEGQYYLGILMEVSDGHGGRSARVFELPIQIGSVTPKPEKPAQQTQGRRLSILQSKEF